MSNYISVTFNKLHKVDAHYVYQWNRGQTLRINGLTLDTAQEIHFSLTPVVGEAITRVGVTTDGVTDVSIPDTLFENDGKTNNYYVYVFIYAHQGDKGETVLYRVNIPVKARPKPEGYGTTDVTPEVFSDVINQVSGFVTNGVTQINKAVTDGSEAVSGLADEAQKAATASANSSLSSAESATKALGYKNDVQQIADSVNDAVNTSSEYADKAKASASAAALSESNAEAKVTDAKEYADKSSEFATNAHTNASAAATSASSAVDSASKASQNATLAQNNAASAATSATNAANSFSNAQIAADKAAASEDKIKTYADNALASEQKAKTSESAAENSATKSAQSAVDAQNNANTAETAEATAQGYMNSAKVYSNEAYKSEYNAKYYTDEAGKIATNVAASEKKTSAYATSALNSANNALTSENNAKTFEESADTNATLSQSYAVGGTNTRVDEDVDNSAYYYQKTKAIAQGIASALVPMGTITFSELPTTYVQIGAMYNISDSFVTTSAFIEGEGIVEPAGANVYYIGNSKWDVLSGTTVTGIKGSAEATYRQGNVNINAANIGLGNLNNTSDENKPISKATQSALDNKADQTALDEEITRAKAAEQQSSEANTYTLSKSADGSTIRLTDGSGKTTSVSNTYTDVTNKPSINGVEITGNRTFAELGEDTISNSELKDIIDKQFNLIFGGN